ncbi:MAG: ribosome small subunit-dependent GTPase A [Christensenellales bacterium]|jgi:ribosome biogenesis GTPase
MSFAQNEPLVPGARTGLLVKGVGGLYTVYCEGEYYPAKARGRFRKNMQKPVIGDRVDFTPAAPGDDFGVIGRIHPRRNSLVRPAVANISLLLAVMASAMPEPDLMLVDKLLVYSRMSRAEAVVVINKIDLGDSAAIAAQYEKSGYEVFCVSAVSGEGVHALKDRMKGHISAYAGQSGVGKSSILNSLGHGFSIETGDVSRIQRGKHTTRHVELLQLGEDSWVSDTPGFSLLEMDMFDPLELKNYYPEFDAHSEGCRFPGCNHISEPGCSVKEAAERGELSMERMERYAMIFQEVKEKWDRRYN